MPWEWPISSCPAVLEHLTNLVRRHLIRTPGGFGTLDEFSEALTLIQTKKMRPFPIVLVGSSYWSGLIEWMKTTQLDTGKISKEDLEIFKIMDDPQQIVDYVKKFVIL